MQLFSEMSAGTLSNNWWVQRDKGALDQLHVRTNLHIHPTSVSVGSSSSGASAIPTPQQQQFSPFRSPQSGNLISHDASPECPQWGPGMVRKLTEKFLKLQEAAAKSRHSEWSSRHTENSRKVASCDNLLDSSMCGPLASPTSPPPVNRVRTANRVLDSVFDKDVNGNPASGDVDSVEVKSPDFSALSCPRDSDDIVPSSIPVTNLAQKFGKPLPVGKPRILQDAHRYDHNTPEFVRLSRKMRPSLDSLRSKSVDELHQEHVYAVENLHNESENHVTYTNAMPHVEMTREIRTADEPRSPGRFAETTSRPAHTSQSNMSHDNIVRNKPETRVSIGGVNLDVSSKSTDSERPELPQSEPPTFVKAARIQLHESSTESPVLETPHKAEADAMSVFVDAVMHTIRLPRPSDVSETHHVDPTSEYECKSRDEMGGAGEPAFQNGHDSYFSDSTQPCTDGVVSRATIITNATAAGHTDSGYGKSPVGEIEYSMGSEPARKESAREAESQTASSGSDSTVIRPQPATRKLPRQSEGFPRPDLPAATATESDSGSQNTNGHAPFGLRKMRNREFEGTGSNVTTVTVPEFLRFKLKPVAGAEDGGRLVEHRQDHAESDAVPVTDLDRFKTSFRTVAQ